MEILDKILDKENLHAAMKKVRQNGGTFGVDKMAMDEAISYFMINENAIIEQIRLRKFKPSPVRRVYIPKSNGKMRGLGIPTIIDRIIQQAVLQVLGPIFDTKFSNNSFGFRPNRSCEMAVLKLLEYFNDKYDWIVDIDLEKFFDNVNHDKLISLVAKTIPDGDVVSLIRKFMQSGVMEDGEIRPTIIGTPQGGNLSPLLSNIMLNELDKELEKRGLNFVRYADDCVIVVKSEKAANRVMESISKFIEKKLGLKVNVEKSKVARPNQIKYLGFGFYMKNKAWRPKPHIKSVQNFVRKLKQLTKRNQGMSMSTRTELLNPVIRGWINYFRIADMKSVVGYVAGHIRRRCREIIWKQWKNCRTRYSNLVKLGVHKTTARKNAWSSKSYWKMSKTPLFMKRLAISALNGKGLFKLKNTMPKYMNHTYL